MENDTTFTEEEFENYKNILINQARLATTQNDKTELRRLKIKENNIIQFIQQMKEKELSGTLSQDEQKRLEQCEKQYKEYLRIYVSYTMNDEQLVRRINVLLDIDKLPIAGKMLLEVMNDELNKRMEAERNNTVNNDNGMKR